MSAWEPVSEYDPLAKLYRQREKLRGAGARGEDVGYAIQEIDRSIGDIIRQREAAQEREQDGGRRR